MTTIKIRKGEEWVSVELVGGTFTFGGAKWVTIRDERGPVFISVDDVHPSDLREKGDPWLKTLVALLRERQAELARADEEAELEAIRQALLEETDISARYTDKPARHCPLCGGQGHVWSGTGYPKLVCGDCGQTIDDDIGGHLAYERGPRSNV